MPSAWVKHVQSVYAKIKGKGGSYRDAMVQAKKSWAKKKGTAAKSDAAAAPKKGRRKKKKVVEDEEPAAEEATRLVEALQEDGILLSTDGPLRDVIKIKPPLVFVEDDARYLLERLAAALP